MYLRHKARHKDGKDHVYWQLVRSVRRNGKVHQETVAHLGELDAAGQAKAQALARRITGRGDQRDLFEAAPAVRQSVEVRLDQIRVERDRSFGGVWLGWVLWQALGLDRVCHEMLPRGRQGMNWAQLAAVLVIARLCEPSSELHIAEHWYRRSGATDLFGVPLASVHHTRLYQGLDRLLAKKESLEQHLRRRLGARRAAAPGAVRVAPPRAVRRRRRPALRRRGRGGLPGGRCRLHHGGAGRPRD